MSALTKSTSPNSANSLLSDAFTYENETVENQIHYELLRNESIQHATLFRREHSNVFILLVSNPNERKALEKKVPLILRRVQSSGIGFSESLSIRVQTSIESNLNTHSVIRSWNSFDPVLRKQLRRWGWLNSPFGYVWIPLWMTLPTLLILFWIAYLSSKH